MSQGHISEDDLQRLRRELVAARNLHDHKRVERLMDELIKSLRGSRRT